MTSMKSLCQSDERKQTGRAAPLQFLSRFPIARWAPIPLRLIVGYGFMEHGFAKLAKGPDAFASYSASDRRAWPTFHGIVHHTD